MGTLRASQIRFASRVTDMQPSQTLAVLNRASELVAKGIDVIDFGPGEPDFDTPSSIGAAAKRAIDEGFTKYTNALGSIELRKAIADTYVRRHGAEVGVGNIISGTGGKQELFNLMLALVSPGDEVIIPSPYWVSFPDQVSFAGGTPVFAPALSEDCFRPTARAIEKAVTSKSRGVIINSPCNPTGAVIREEELKEVIELCHRHEMFLVFDETYEFFVYGDNRHVSAAKWFGQFPETVIVVNSMSKTFAMTGWRLGYAIAHPDVISAVGKIQSHSTSNPSSISQRAAIEALRVGEREVEKMYQAYVERRQWLVTALNEIPGVRCPMPDGAFYVFPDISSIQRRAGMASSSKLATYLLDEARVAVVPGDAFGEDGYIRISYATSMEKLKEGVSRIRRAVDKIGHD